MRLCLLSSNLCSLRNLRTNFFGFLFVPIYGKVTYLFCYQIC